MDIIKRGDKQPEAASCALGRGLFNLQPKITYLFAFFYLEYHFSDDKSDSYGRVKWWIYKDHYPFDDASFLNLTLGYFQMVAVCGFFS
ncbi:hypothetical protein [Brenneria corticis]|uniref:hypothetical protein n=1 Tax=Brenneria corticis TaxID=2173106 RepID=UPI00109DB15F|nr:hypothetical protein [Brenneria sp. CFCC 11842]